MIPKEMKYNLHNGKVRRDVLPLPLGTETTDAQTHNCNFFLVKTVHILIIIYYSI